MPKSSYGSLQVNPMKEIPDQGSNKAAKEDVALNVVIMHTQRMNDRDVNNSWSEEERPTSNGWSNLG